MPSSKRKISQSKKCVNRGSPNYHRQTGRPEKSFTSSMFVKIKTIANLTSKRIQIHTISASNTPSYLTRAGVCDGHIATRSIPGEERRLHNKPQIIERQCSDNPPYNFEYVHRVEEEVGHRVSLPPKGNLDPITQDEISKRIKALKIRMATGIDSISTWKEAVVIEIPKPGKPRDLPPRSNLIRKSLIINNQSGFHHNHSCPQQALRLVEYISEGLKTKKMTVAVFFDVAKVFDRAKTDTLYDLQVVQNKFCRRAADAPWYIKNFVLHRDLQLQTISKFMKDASERFFNIANSHPNPLLVSAVSYEPPPSYHFCRRPRNVLLDPPDDLTVEVEKLIEVNKMAID
ncbi:Probable RNA-directed DNA polymerase from transposon BS [Eumeta japonica]|uniref:Probable RNA-directed DNA polymerase from transposon BS n=1 Tax=Eumeta variegata TaxID=151549 RepID=A0A4C1V1B1_EUMVA|nr:Probable RNA-directed DNA polymerase from transposon BS [Eumeta japonica]